ncbi:MAG: fimbrillin family protein [Bacteroidales bacterium]|nr:fimbrillin family protein [Bacteroidales bacterium]
MNRFFIIMASIAVSVASCTKSGLLEAPDTYADAISFEPYLGKVPVTKAVNSDLAFLKTGHNNGANSGGFQVYSFMHGANNVAPTTFTSPYMAEEVWWSTSTSTWDYSNVTYWPEDRSLSFVAFGLNASKGGCLELQDKTSQTPDLTKYTFTVKDKVSEQVDLIVAPYQTGLEATETNSNVNLQFKHLLSRIGFSVMSTAASSAVDIAIRSITLHGAFFTTAKVDLTALNSSSLPYVTDKSGSQTVYSLFDSATQCFTIGSDECNVTSGSPIYYNTNIVGQEPGEWGNIYSPLTYVDDAAKAADVNKRYMMLLPCDMPDDPDDAYIEVRYQLTSDIVRSAKVSLAGFSFAAGNSYEFILKVSTSSIDFDATMNTDWSDASTNSEVYPLTPIR